MNALHLNIRRTRGTVALVALVAGSVLVYGLPSPAVASVAVPAAKPVPTVAGLQDAAAAMAAAQRQDSRVEVLEARTDSSETFAEPDGTYTTEATAAPVRTQAKDGSWTDIDTTLVADGSGGWEPKSGGEPLTISGGGTGPFATLNPSGAGKVALSWPTALPTPVVSGSTATYTDVQPGVDLVVRALPEGFTESLVLTERPDEPVSFLLPITTGGGQTKVTDDGTLVVTAGGDEVASAPVPMMWDDSASPSGDQVDAQVKTTSSGSTLVLTPDPVALQDPATVYPVTVDPTFTAAASGDSWMQNPDFTTAQRGSTELRVGTSDAGTHVARSFLHFRAAEKVFLGAKVNSATLTMSNWASSTCTGAAIQVQRITQDWAGETMTWANQPTVTSTDAATYSPAYGAPTGTCTAPGTATWNLAPLVQTWADGQPNYGLRASAVSESDSNSWRQYRSMNYSVTAEQPTLTVNYNSYPGTPDSLTWSPKGTYTTGGTTTAYVTKLTPWLSGQVADPDGATVTGKFSLLEGSTLLLDKASGTTVASGQVSQYHVPLGKLVDGHTYTVQSWASDGTLLTKTPATTTFTVDTTSPAAPTVSSSTFAANTWTYGSTSGPFTFTDTSSDTVGWQYSFDAGTTWTTLGGGSTSLTTTITPPPGWNTMKVQAIDKAGRSGPSASYIFGANPAMTAPLDQQQTPQSVLLDGVGPSIATGVTFQYRLPGTTTWTNIPTAHVLNNGTQTAITSWPVNVKAGGSSNEKVPNFGMTWNVLSTRGNADGAIEVRASWSGTGGPWTTAGATVSVDRKAIGGDYASQPVGPGSVSLLTGAFSYGAAEGTVSRTFNSNDTATTGLFGPGWTTALPAGWISLTDQGSSVVVTGSDGSVSTFAKKSSGGWVGQADAVDLTLTSSGSGSSTVYKLSNSDGAAASFGWNGAGTFQATPTVATANSYRVTTYVEAGSHTIPGALTTKYAYNTSGTYVGLPKEIFDPPADGHDCTVTWSIGCRSTQIAYTGATAALARISSVTIRTPNAAGTDQFYAVGCYSYDASSRLTQAWDPRTVSATCVPGSPVLPTGYGYDASNRLTSITPPSQAAYNLTYDGTGRVTAASRTHNATYGSGTVTTSIVYGVPTSTNSTNPEYNPDLTNTVRKTWAQNSVPAAATAVFAPGANVSSTDLRDGIVHVLDVNGREINTAGYSGTGQSGWKVAATDFDQYGNVVRTLTPENRDLALALDAAVLDQLGLPSSSTNADLARAVDNRTVYSADGIDVLDSFGPLHVVMLPDRTQVPARQHVHTTYGTVDMTLASPTLPADPTTGGPLHAAIQTDESASRGPGATATADTDTRTTKYAYGLSTTDTAGWYLGTPMRVTTVVPGGSNIVRETRYDATNGQTLEVRQPSAAGASSNAGTTKFVYYTVGANSADSACGNKPEWSGFMCTQGPGAQPGVSGLPGLPTKRVTNYDLLGHPTVTTDTVTDASGTQKVRTSTVTYDGPGATADRIKTAAVSGGVGAAVPVVTYSYSTTTGLPTTTTSDNSAGAGLAGTVTSGNDDFGNPVSYTDADGAVTNTAYDTAGRPATMTFLKPDASTLGTSTITYNGGTEHRGMVTTLTHSGLGGSFTGSYNADGAIKSQTWPDGMTTSLAYDPTGDQTSLVDTKNGNVFLSDVQTANVHGQWATESGALLPFSRDYTYDGAGRLTTVADTSADPAAPGCTTRTYGFDVNSNRTSKNSYPPATDASCSTATTPTSVTSTFDAADRLQATGTHAGLSYDTFGRATTLPAADTSPLAAAATNLIYYVTDVVASTNQGAASRAWTLDPGSRLRRQTAEAGNSTIALNHYSGTGDSPTWIVDTNAAGTATTTRYLTDLTGGMAATVGSGGTPGTLWQLVGLHGDVERTTTPTANLAPDGGTTIADEYGVTAAAPARYGYLGSYQRANDVLSGLTYMGARVYGPVLGQFLQVDPILGGNSTPYGYPTDPINQRDLDGRQLPKNGGGGSGSAAPVYSGSIIHICGTITCSFYFSRKLTEKLVVPSIMGATLSARIPGVGWVLSGAATFLAAKAAEAASRNQCLRIRHLAMPPYSIVGAYSDGSKYCGN